VPLGRVDETNVRPIGYADCHRWTSNRIVTDRKLPEAEVDAVSEQLQDGIQTCRSVIANYRSLLTNDPVTPAVASETSDLTNAEGDDSSDRAHHSKGGHRSI
jgi:hypothetical protein